MSAQIDDARLGEEVSSVCFTRGIQGFYDTTDNSVVLSRGEDDKYLVTTKFCPELRFAHDIYIDTSTNCLKRSNYLRIVNSTVAEPDLGNVRVKNCFINAIYKWDKDATDLPANEDDEALD